ncbi:hypothetical protein D3C72_1017490 [compost metagenome]
MSAVAACATSTASVRRPKISRASACHTSTLISRYLFFSSRAIATASSIAAVTPVSSAKYALASASSASARPRQKRLPLAIERSLAATARARPRENSPISSATIARLMKAKISSSARPHSKHRRWLRTKASLACGKRPSVR